MAQLIVLIGPGQCGKTTTLNQLYGDLLTSGSSINTFQKPLMNMGGPEDFEADIYSALKGKRIAIFSMGDTVQHVLAAIQKYMAMPGIDVLIVAFNNSHMPSFQTIQNQYNPLVVQKTKNPKNLQVTADTTAVNQILSSI